jgi:signal transduction histidine kinase
VGISRAIRITSLLTWVVIGGTVLVKYASMRDLFEDYCVWVWAVAFTTGILASARSWSGRVNDRRAVLALLLVASVSVLFVNRWWPSHWGGLPLVFVAWEAAQILSLPTVSAWVALQTVGLALLMVPFPWNHVKHPISLPAWFGNTLAVGGLQAFAVLAAHLMRREAESRAELARANQELIATRELVIHGSRSAERLRIARELHDAIGHHLSALSINLEVAGMGLERDAAEVRAPLEKARSVTRTMLTDVRNVVGQLRREEATDLAAALTSLAAAIPSPAIHLSIPSALPPVDAERAQALLRCAQECVTNAIRHSSARNLWIELDASGGGLGLRVRDDGHGAPNLAEGSGLSGMRERLTALRGRLRLAPGPPGFEAHVWLP